MIGVRVDDVLLAEIDRVRGDMSRSDFVRRAAFDALLSAGSDLPKSVVAAPDRAGKGGRPKKDTVSLVAEDSVDSGVTLKAPKQPNLPGRS
jgi:hypothetical protein